ncbi:hypothetical protein [Mycobacterium botniense]|uniref:Uncharacterized protein n=1 Tax=Mycobacterium botniense TaxID=84962 RepID=A0A7I9XUL1_9MYCO|nr:hypothetical protein [Mycobacterium botniense]GFG73046.1 hypothetical protein MBOT_04110 [Mycobacterium botniense]
MAGRFEVAARLAEGRPAAEHTQRYVWACGRLGYHHPDLTTHESQVRDWYDTEYGLDLHALDSDCALLWAVRTAAEDALRLQRALVAELAAAWTGPGADSAIRFVQRHCDAGGAVVAALGAAAEGCAALRDGLWQLVDSKVAAAVAIDDRSLAQRPAWLAAARAVTTGAGDVDAAEKIVDQEVKPYVDTDIRIDWLTEMCAARAAVAASYDTLIHRLLTAPTRCFELPGDLGSDRPVPPQEPGDGDGAAGVAPVTAPAALSAGDRAAASAPDSAEAAARLLPPAGSAVDTMPPTSPPPAGPRDFAPAPPGLEAFPGMPAGTPAAADGLGDSGAFGGVGSLGSLVGQIAGAIGGLLASLTAGVADSLAADSSPDGLLDGDAALDDDVPAEPAEEPGEKADGQSGAPPGQPPDGQADEPEGGDIAAAEPVAASASGSRPGDTTDQQPNPSPAEPPSTAAPPDGGPPPSPPPQSQPGGSTPCEIAADELPQAGQ